MVQCDFNLNIYSEAPFFFRLFSILRAEKDQIFWIISTPWGYDQKCWQHSSKKITTQNVANTFPHNSAILFRYCEKIPLKWLKKLEMLYAGYCVISNCCTYITWSLTLDILWSWICVISENTPIPVPLIRVDFVDRKCIILRGLILQFMSARERAYVERNGTQKTLLWMPEKFIWTPEHHLS